jgi:hypothetical protein
LASSDPEERNAAIKKIFENLSQAGQVREISVKPAESSSTGQKQLQPKEPQTAETFGDVLRGPMLRSRFRVPIAVAVVLVCGLIGLYEILPEEVKLQLLSHVVNVFHHPPGGSTTAGPPSPSYKIGLWYTSRVEGVVIASGTARLNPTTLQVQYRDEDGSTPTRKQAMLNTRTPTEISCPVHAQEVWTVTWDPTPNKPASWDVEWNPRN